MQPLPLLEPQRLECLSNLIVAEFFLREGKWTCLARLIPYGWSWYFDPWILWESHHKTEHVPQGLRSPDHNASDLTPRPPSPVHKWLPLLKSFCRGSWRLEWNSRMKPDRFLWKRSGYARLWLLLKDLFVAAAILRKWHAQSATKTWRKRIKTFATVSY